MDTDTDIDFSTLHLARLTPIDVARALGVTRVTASMWLNKHTQPHSLIRERVEKFLDAVYRAVEAGQLPVPHRVTRRERRRYIQDVLARFGFASS